MQKPMASRNTGFTASDKKAIIAVIVIVLGLVSIMALRFFPSHKPIATPQIVIAPEPELHRVSAGFLISGKIAKLNFSAGSEVNKGDVLASLEKRESSDEIVRARANMKGALAQYDAALHRPKSNFSAIEAAKADAEEAQRKYDKAHEELIKRRRQQVHGEKDNVYDDDIQNESDARIELERSHRWLVYQEQIGMRDEDISMYKANIEKAENAVAISQINAIATELIAPVSGVISIKNVEIGDLVNAGDPIYTISIPKEMATKAP